ncbi:MAG: hypothetical protein A2Y17_02555 [Clostridiales bacterium GWF2_38_85]|nr:MAG: hypothetical protein A2Y17_02555 [Clostridiales bacterium GWF2_38_85]
MPTRQKANYKNNQFKQNKSASNGDSQSRKEIKTIFKSNSDRVQEVKEKLNSIDEKLINLAERLDSPETIMEIKKVLEFQASFYNYSFHNQMFLFFQSIERNYYLEQVASFQQWKSLKKDNKENVHVRKGEHGFYVLVPVEYTIYERDEEGNYILDSENEKIPELDENGEIKKGLTFKLGYVFDVNQTNAKELGIYKKLAYRNNETLIDESIMNKLIESIINRYKLNIEFKNIGAAGGYYKKSENLIVINNSEEKTVANKISTLFHELGHFLMHSSDEDTFRRDKAEGEAEGFSYILSSFFGIENKSELYIKSWGNNADEFKATLENISTTAKKAIRELNLEKI